MPAQRRKTRRIPLFRESKSAAAKHRGALASVDASRDPRSLS
jgi:hypothetical protein